jgi:hypothetical protein
LIVTVGRTKLRNNHDAGGYNGGGNGVGGAGGRGATDSEIET